MAIHISKVETPAQMKAFIRVPALVQRDNPHFIARLDLEMKDHLSAKNPYFDHAQHAFFIAYENGSPTGRISAQIDELAQTEGAPIIGHFGFLEADKDSTMGALIDTAEDWLRTHGAKSVQGPFSLSINDEMGLLVEGFDAPPRIMMNHAPEWYGRALEDAQYTKSKDVLAYDLELSHALPKSLQRLADETEKQPSITERAIDMKHFERDLRIILGIFNDAWADNWGFIPMTDDEITYSAANMKMIINPALARLIFVDDKPAAMIVALPDLNEAVADLDGKLLPLGFTKLLWRLKIRGLKTARVLLMGVRKEFHDNMLSSGLSALLIANLRKYGQAQGYEHVELSWVLEDNKPMNRLIQAAGGRAYKRYRIYEKAL